jgi:glycosyltransferase involved in cell wall biosynthesis
VNTAIIVPVYNEGNRAVETINKVLKRHKSEVVIINDGSTDNSYKLLRNEYRNVDRVTVLNHVINLGKGAAMKTGAEYAFNNEAEAVLFLDADGQHNPKYISRFKRYLKEYPMVFGYRLLNKKMPFIRKWGNIAAANLIKVLFGIKKKDLLSGYLGFRKEVYEQIKWGSPRYGIETEMATRVGKNKIPFKEIKIDTIYIDKYKGVTILDALKILVQIPFWYFSK